MLALYQNYFSSSYQSSPDWYFLIFPVADSILNYSRVGQSLWNIQNGLDEAFNVILVGYTCLWIGKVAFDMFHVRKGSLRESRLDHVVWWVFANRNTRWTYVLIYAPFIIFVLSFGLIHFGSDIRVLLGINGFLRPVMNIVMSAYPTIVLIYFLLFFQYRRKIDLYISVFLASGSILLASRSVVFSSLVSAFLFYSINRGRRISLLKVGLFGSFAFVGIFALSFLRNGGLTGFNMTSLLDDVLYGNTFSDTRDFAWVLGYWDGELLWGKTYAAGILSFIPSALSDFRQHWGMGRFTLITTGMYSDEAFHGGLRCSIFGEPYFNFGIIGVIVISIIYGYYIEKVNCKVTHYCKKGSYLKAFSATAILKVLGCMMISSGSFSIYLFFIPIFGIYFFSKCVDSLNNIKGRCKLHVTRRYKGN